MPNCFRLIGVVALATCVFLSILEAPHAAEEYQPLTSFKNGASHLLDRESQIALAIGAAAFLGARQLDEEARDYFGNRKRIGELSRIGNEVLGTGMFGVAMGAGFWIYGDLAEDSFKSHLGQAQIESLLTTTLIVSGLKAVTNRIRPDESGNDSLPSAHTAYAFTAATVLNEFYGAKVGVPAYALAVLTAVGRMQDDRHWLTDTVGGATIAILVSRAFSRSHLKRYDTELQREAESARKLTIRPNIGAKSVGVVMRYEF